MRRQVWAVLAVWSICVAASPGGWRDAVRKIENNVEKHVDREVDRAVDKTHEAATGEKPQSASQGDSAKQGDARGDASAGGSASYPARKPNDTRKYPPGLSFSTVLNGLKLRGNDGQFQLHHIQATFLPDDGRTGFAVLRTQDGKGLYRFEYKSEELKKPYFLLDFWKTTDLTSGKNLGAGWVDMKKPGEYVLDFYTPSEHFYTFPFSVRKAGGDDPFGDGDAWLIDGDWRDWAYLYYGDADPSRPLVWKVWLRNDGPGEKDVKPRVEIKRAGDGALVCVSREIAFSLQPTWNRFELDMIFPPKGTSGGGYFKAKDLVNTDGDYVLTMTLDGQEYGVWEFSVAGGKPAPAGRSMRGQADALTFVEGGRDAFWYARRK